MKFKTLLLACPLAFLLASCGGEGGKPEEVKFSVVESMVRYDSSQKKAEVKLDWTPSEHIISIDNCTFTYVGGVTTDIEVTSTTSRPREIGITFSEDLTDDVTGTLTFDYEDKTAKTTGKGEVGSITIDVEPYNYKFTFEGTNCTAGNEEYYETSASVSFTITSVDSKHALPMSSSDIEVIGVDSYNYVYGGTGDTATFSCTMPDNEVKVKVKASLIINISSKVSGITFDSPTVLEGNEYDGTINLESTDKVLPDTQTGLKSVILDPEGEETDITSYCTYERTADRKVASLKIPADFVTADIEVDLELEDAPDGYEFEFKGTNCVSSALTEYAEGDPVSFNIYPQITQEGLECALPVSLPDDAVTGVDVYEYKIVENTNYALFTCTMPANKVTLEIEATIIPSHLLTFTMNYCSSESEIKESYQEGAMIYVEDITPEDNYVLPETIAVTGTDDYEYEVDDDTGIGYFFCSMPTADLTVTITAIPV